MNTKGRPEQGHLLRSGLSEWPLGGAFTLSELILVIVIIAIIAAIAVPRMSSASQSAQVNSLKQSTTVVRKAMELYLAEHGQYPGKDATSGLLTNAAFIQQLTYYTDVNGRTRTTLAAPFIYGPYLRPPFPTNPRSDLNTVIVLDTPASTMPAKGSSGWVAIFTTGDFGPNMPGSGSVDVGDIQAGVKGITGIGS